MEKEEEKQQQTDVPQSWGKQTVTAGDMLVWCGLTFAAYWLTLTHLKSRTPGTKEATR